MAKNLALAFGAIYLVVGLLGFVMNPILGIFPVNTLHNIVHLAIGVVLLGAATMAPMGADSARTANIVVGAVLLLVAVLGFVAPQLMQDLLAIDMADNFLHLGSGAILAVGGWMAPRAAMTPA